METNIVVIDETLEEYLLSLSISNPSALSAMKQAGYTDVNRLKMAPPSSGDLANYGFSKAEQKLIKRSLTHETKKGGGKRSKKSSQLSKSTDSKKGLTSSDPIGESGLSHSHLVKKPTLSTDSSPSKKTSSGTSSAEPSPRARRKNDKPLSNTITSSEAHVEWFWRSDDKVWQPYDKENSRDLEAAFSSKQEICQLAKGHFEEKQCVVDFRTMRQRNMDTGFERRVKREEGEKKTAKMKTETNEQFDSICTAAFERNLQKVEQLIPLFTNEQLKMLRNSRGQSLLYCAALGGSYELTKLLLSLNLPLSIPQGPKLSTPLHAASWKGNAEVVALLLLSGADPDMKNEMGLIPQQEATSTSKLAWDIFESEGKNGMKRLLPVPSIRFILNLKSCSVTLKTNLTSEPSTTVDLIITLLEYKEEKTEEQKLARWMLTKTTNCDQTIIQWDKKVKLDLIDLQSVKVQFQVIQHSEVRAQKESGSIIRKTRLSLGSCETTFDVFDHSVDKQCLLPLEGNATLDFSLTTKYLDDSRIKRSINKLFANNNNKNVKNNKNGNFTEKQVVDFYMKVRHALSEFKTTQLNSSKKEAIKALLKIPKKPEEEQEFELELGNFYPFLCCENFTRGWDSLDLKQKYKHILGFNVYAQPLFDAAELFDQQSSISFQDFMEQYVLVLNFTPILEKVWRKYQVMPMNSICMSIRKYLLKEHSII